MERGGTKCEITRVGTRSDSSRMSALLRVGFPDGIINRLHRVASKIRRGKIYRRLDQVLAFLRCKADILRTRREAMHVLILALQDTFENAGTARCRAQGHVPR